MHAEIPIGRTNDLLVALANMGSKMFNVTHIEGELQDAKGSGEVLISLGRTDYGQSLGPKEQRSFRFPMALGAEEKLGVSNLDVNLTSKGSGRKIH